MVGAARGEAGRTAYLHASRMRAEERPLLRVGALVPREERAVDETLAAAVDLAHPRLLPGVDPVVTVEAPARAERLAAVGPRAIMHLVAPRSSRPVGVGGRGGRGSSRGGRGAPGGRGGFPAPRRGWQPCSRHGCRRARALLRRLRHPIVVERVEERADVGNGDLVMRHRLRPPTSVRTPRQPLTGRRVTASVVAQQQRKSEPWGITSEVAVVHVLEDWT